MEKCDLNGGKSKENLRIEAILVIKMEFNLMMETLTNKKEQRKPKHD